MTLDTIDAADLDLLRRCLRACAEGPFFEETEFAGMFGTTRAAFTELMQGWNDGAEDSPELLRAIESALGNLLTCPRRREAELARDFGIDRAQLEALCSRWRR